MTALFVIEAPFKIKALKETLEHLEIDAKVVATKGHIMQMPERLTPLSIDRTFQEQGRAPRDPEALVRLRETARECNALYIATDADQEGDVIAWDVHEVLKDIFPQTLRVKLCGMDRKSVEEAIREASPIRKEDAVPGRTRAILDRMIGGLFSHDGVAVGRVSTALLGIVAKHTPATATLRLQAPDEGRGRPWNAEFPVTAPLTREVARKLAGTALPAIGKADRKETQRPKPASMGEILVRAGDEMDISPAEAADAMQKSYEAGRLSYPRAAAKGLNMEAIANIGAMFRKAGYKFDEKGVHPKGEDEVHDAPHPIGAFNVNSKPHAVGSVEGVRTLIGRDLVRTGQDTVVEFALTADLHRFLIAEEFSAEIADLVCGASWRRESGPRYPGQDHYTDSTIIERRPDTALLERAVELGVGRPSTWARHIEKIMERDLFDDRLELTAKGQRWVDGSPAVLLDPRLAAGIDRALENFPSRIMDSDDREPWEILAQAIVSKLPEAIRIPMMKAIEGVDPKPRVDLVADYGLDHSVVADIAQRRAPAPAYTPYD